MESVTSQKTTIVKRVDHANKVFKVAAFHQHKNSEVFDFTSAEEANVFYDQLKLEDIPNSRNESRFNNSFQKEGNNI
jgi:hypothetical protein